MGSIKDVKGIVTAGGVRVKRLWLGTTAGNKLIRDWTGPTTPVEPTRTVKTLGWPNPYYFGYAWDEYKTLNRPDYNNAFTQDAQMLNPENGFSPGHVCPSCNLDDFTNIAEIGDPDNYNWDFKEADASIVYAKKINGVVHISHLTWHRPSPTSDKPYIKQIIDANPGREKEALTAHFQMRITKVMTRYKNEPTVVSVNVLNEFLENDGTQKESQVTPFFTAYEFFEMTLIACTAAAPNKKRFITDYNYENGSWERMNNTLAMAAQLDAKNIIVNGNKVTLQGVGFQFHARVQPEWDLARSRMQAVAKAGLLFMYAEMDADTGRIGNFYTLREDLGEESMEAIVSKFYWDAVVNVEKAVPPGQIWAFILWSATDRDNYMQTISGDGAQQGKLRNAPGTTNAIIKFPVIRDWWGNKKEAYQALIDVQKRLPMTGKIFQDFEEGFWIPNLKDTFTKGTSPQRWTQRGNTAVIAMTDIGIAQKQASSNTYTTLTVPSLGTSYTIKSKIGNGNQRTIRTQHFICRFQDINNLIAVASKYVTGTNQYYALIMREGGVESEVLKTTVLPVKGDVIETRVTPTRIILVVNDIAIGTLNSSKFGTTTTEVGFRFKGYDDKQSAWKDFILV